MVTVKNMISLVVSNSHNPGVVRTLRNVRLILSGAVDHDDCAFRSDNFCVRGFNGDAVFINV